MDGGKICQPLFERALRDLYETEARLRGLVWSPIWRSPPLAFLAILLVTLAAFLDEVCGHVDTMGRAGSATQGREWR